MKTLPVAPEDLIEFAQHLRTSGKLPATCESYSRDARHFLTFLDEQKISAEELNTETLFAYQDHLKVFEQETQNTIRRAVIGVRQFFRFLVLSGRIESTPFDMVPIPPRVDKIPPPLSEADIDGLIDVAGSGLPKFRAARDVCLLCLLAYEGLKATEIIQLKWADLLLDQGAAFLRITGPKERRIMLSPETRAALSHYRKEASAHSLGEELFAGYKGRMAARKLPRLTRHGLKFVLYELGEQSGLSHLNTEQLRHYAIDRMVLNGWAPDEIMDHLGLKRLGIIASHFALSPKAAEPKPSPSLQVQKTSTDLTE